MERTTEHSMSLQVAHNEHLIKIYTIVVDYISRIPGITINQSKLETLSQLNERGLVNWPPVAQTFSQRNEVTDLIQFEGNPIRLSISNSWYGIQAYLHWNYRYNEIREHSDYSYNTYKYIKVFDKKDLQWEFLCPVERDGHLLTETEVINNFTRIGDQHAHSNVQLEIHRAEPASNTAAIKDRNDKQLSRQNPDRIANAKKAIYKRYLNLRRPKVELLVGAKQQLEAQRTQS